MLLLRSIVLLAFASALAVFVPNAGAATRTATGGAGVLSGEGGYADLLLAGEALAAPPCGQGQRLARCGFSANAHVQPRPAAQFSRIAYSSERPVCYAVALLSQTREADRCPEDDGRGRPASLPGSISKGPFGGAAAAHARL